jgi:hypothetical protein
MTPVSFSLSGSTCQGKWAVFRCDVLVKGDDHRHSSGTVHTLAKLELLVSQLSLHMAMHQHSACTCQQGYPGVPDVDHLRG